MWCVREHIHGGSGDEYVFFRAEQLQIPRQRAGIAGDIDDTLRLHGENGVDCLTGKTLAGRIYRDAVRTKATLRKRLRGFASVTAEKLCVLNLICLSIFSGIFNGFRYDFCSCNWRRNRTESH